MTHKLLEVINVKQGDCFILRPDYDCIFKQQAIIIDTGNGIYDYTKRLENDEPFHVLLTHSHIDHVNGFNLLLSNRLKDMRTLLLPYYHNESVLIALALLRLRGMATLSDSWGLKRQLNQIISNQRLLVNLSGKIKILFVYDGFDFCDHMTFLNPPLMWENFSERINNENLQAILNLFDEDFARELSLYLRMSLQNARFPDAPSIDRIMVQDYENERYNNDMRNRSNYVLGYLLENFNALQSFNEHPTQKNCIV